MSNIKIFKALSCKTRIDILKILVENEKHISGIAREIGISVPVVSRHIKILENAGLITIREIGNIHLLSAKIDELKNVFDPFIEQSSVVINENDSIFDALKQLPFIKIKKIGNNQFITTVDSKEGYYTYEVDGEIPDISIDEYLPSKDVFLYLNQFISITKRKIIVKVRNQNEK
jgi:DNA-binding transcriptional ArsR family regulator